MRSTEMVEVDEQVGVGRESSLASAKSLRMLNHFIERVSKAELFELKGRVLQVKGSVVEVIGLHLPIGSQCYIALSTGQVITAAVASFQLDRLFVIPFAGTNGIEANAAVSATAPIVQTSPLLEEGSLGPCAKCTQGELPVGVTLLGRVIDASGQPLDGRGRILASECRHLSSAMVNPLDREPIKEVLDVGVRSINSTLTIGRGQRIGLFAGSGVGKSVLLGMMARYTDAQIVVIALIGERGREVKEFIEKTLGAESLAHCVVIAAPADAPAQMRVQAANYAATIAECFRDQGLHVLLIMDSLTRFAMAHREIALSLGEVPATKGYPASVFTKLPALVERAGNGVFEGGSVTAFYTVLTEGDDQMDPIADSARAILDGHIVLDRSLAESGHYPAIDLAQSISRVRDDLITHEHKLLARRLKQLWSTYQRSSDLFSVGAYVSGGDALLDEAVQLHHKINEFLQQDVAEQVDFQTSLNMLRELFVQSNPVFVRT